MNGRLVELAVERGRLRERITRQRAEIGSELVPLRNALLVTDRGVAQVRAAVDAVRRHPSIVVAALAVFVVLKPGRLWRWGRRAFVGWRAWRFLRERLDQVQRFKLKL